MTASLYYSRLTAASWAATSSKSGYTASNAGSTGIARPWASNATGTQQLTGDLSTTQTIRAIALQSCPLSTADIRVDGSSTPTTSRGAIVPAQAGHGVYRGSLAMNVSARYVSAYWTGPTLLGGNAGVYSREPASYEVGTLYAFGATLSLPCEPLLESDLSFEYPQTVERLPNGQQITVSRGAPVATITLRFRPTASQDIERIARIARAGISWLDLGIAARPDLQWPVKCIEDSIGRQFRGGADAVALTFREVT
jgi:hypothetical protein